MKNVLLIVAFSSLVFCSYAISAAAEEKTEEKGAAALEQTLKKAAEGQKETEIQGLVIDQTQTLMGATFYQTFVTFWEAPPEVGEDYNIVIVERASASWGSWIWVTVNDRIVYQNIMKPRSGDIVETVKESVEIVRIYLLSAFRDGAEIEDIDLKGKDL